MVSEFIFLDKLYPAVPYVERGKRVIIGAHPKGGFVVYPNKKNVIIRDLSVCCLILLLAV